MSDLPGDGQEWESVAPDPLGLSHAPVLLDEVIEGLAVGPGFTAIDGTLGGAGHTRAILGKSAPSGRVLGIDADPAALRRTANALGREIAEGRLILAAGRFAEMESIAGQAGFSAVDGVLLDLGVSSFQLETAARGFSFQSDGPLDMRFDPTQGVSADEIVNQWQEDELAALIYRYGEEHRSRIIARTIVRLRPILTTGELAAAVEKATGGRRGSRTHPATQTFQALRLVVNDELGQLESVLPQALRLLRPGGRLAVIAFHSLEDRLAKQWMAYEASDWLHDSRHPMGGVPHEPTLRLVSRRAIMAGAEERESNPRSRSARLRIVERIAGMEDAA